MYDGHQQWILLLRYQGRGCLDEEYVARSSASGARHRKIVKGMSTEGERGHACFGPSLPFFPFSLTYQLIILTVPNLKRLLLVKTDRLHTLNDLKQTRHSLRSVFWKRL